MKILLLLPLAGLALLLSPLDAVAQMAPSKAQMVSSPEAIVEAAYSTMIREPGEKFGWDTFRHVFHPDAKLYPHPEQTDGTYRVLTREGFISWVDSLVAANDPIGSELDKGFAEEDIWHEVHRFGDVAHVFSAYQKHYYGEDDILGRGVNSYQLVFREGRWWIVSVVWDEESSAGPIPSEYLPE